MQTRSRQQILTLIAIALTFASGANDVASFTRLGGVFTSVMTGNIVLWGLAVARGSLSLASHTAVSLAGYIIGVATGTWIAHGFKAANLGKASPAEAGDDQDRASVLPAHVNWSLAAELAISSAPLAPLPLSWSGNKTTRRDYAAMCDIAQDIPRVARRA